MKTKKKSFFLFLLMALMVVMLSFVSLGSVLPTKAAEVEGDTNSIEGGIDLPAPTLEDPPKNEFGVVKFTYTCSGLATRFYLGQDINTNYGHETFYDNKVEVYGIPSTGFSGVLSPFKWGKCVLVDEEGYDYSSPISYFPTKFYPANYTSVYSKNSGMLGASGASCDIGGKTGKYLVITFVYDGVCDIIFTNYSSNINFKDYDITVGGVKFTATKSGNTLSVKCSESITCSSSSWVGSETGGFTVAVTSSL